MRILQNAAPEVEAVVPRESLAVNFGVRPWELIGRLGEVHLAGVTVERFDNNLG
jgi:hypothetical protein